LETIGKLLSIPAILELPWFIGIPGLMIAAALVWSAFLALLSLRILKSATRLIMAVLIVIILGQGGPAIVQLIEKRDDPPAANPNAAKGTLQKSDLSIPNGYTAPPPHTNIPSGRSI
jgi:hypothetical protein